MPRATSACKNTSTRWRSATSRSGCCRERPCQAVGDDVPAVLHLGRVVHHDRGVHDPSWNGDADALALHGEPDRGHRGAVLPRARRGPLLRDREGAGRAPPAGRRRDVRRAPGRGRARRVHPAPVVLQPVLHADPRPREQPGVSPHPVTGEAVSDRKSTRLNSSHLGISYAVFCLKKKKKKYKIKNITSVLRYYT